jgi:hypothetical protein
MVEQGLPPIKPNWSGLQVPKAKERTRAFWIGRGCGVVIITLTIVLILLGVLFVVEQVMQHLVLGWR